MARPFAALLAGLLALALLPAAFLFLCDVGLLHWLAAIGLTWWATRFSRRVAEQTTDGRSFEERLGHVLARAGHRCAGLGMVLAVTAPILVFAIGEFLWSRATQERIRAIAITRQVRDAELRIRKEVGFHVELGCLSDPARCPAGVAPATRLDLTERTALGHYRFHFHGVPDGEQRSRLSAFVYYAAPEASPSRCGQSEAGVCADSTGRLCYARDGALLDTVHGRCPESCTDVDPPAPTVRPASPSS